MILLPCIFFSGLIIWHQTTNQCVLPQGELLLWSTAFLVAYSSLCEVETSWDFPISIGMFISVILIQLKLRQSCWQDITDKACNIIRRHNLRANSLIFWLLQHHWPSSAMFPDPSQCESVLFMYHLRLGYTTPHFDPFCFSVVVSVCCKEKFS